MRRGGPRTGRPASRNSSDTHDVQLSAKDGSDPSQENIDDQTQRDDRGNVGLSRGVIGAPLMVGLPSSRPTTSCMTSPRGGFPGFPLVGISSAPHGPSNAESFFGNCTTGGFAPPVPAGVQSKPFYVKNTFLSTSADADHRSRTESCDAVLEGGGRVREVPIAPPETVLEAGEGGEASISDDADTFENHREARLSESGLSLFGAAAERYALVEAFHKESLDAAFDYMPYMDFRAPLPFGSLEPNGFGNPDHGALALHDPAVGSPFLFEGGRLPQMCVIDERRPSVAADCGLRHEFTPSQVDFGNGAECLPSLDDDSLSPELGRQATPPLLSPMASSRARTFVSQTNEPSGPAASALKSCSPKHGKSSPGIAVDPPVSGTGAESPKAERRKAPRKCATAPGSDVQSRDGYANQENEKAASAGWTTIMLRNIPNKYTQKMLLDVINKNFSGLYDFFYLPIDFRNKCNVGYAFINFIHWHYAVMFREQFDGLRLGAFKSNKVCEVSWGRVQGLATNIEHYRNSAVMSIPIAEYKPMLFKNGVVVPFPEADGPLPLVKLRPQKC